MTTLQTSINCPNERVSPGLSPSFFSKWLKTAVVIHAITMRPHTDRQQRRVRPPSRLTCTSEKCHIKREKIIDFSPCPPTSRAPRLTSKVHLYEKLEGRRQQRLSRSNNNRFPVPARMNPHVIPFKLRFSPALVGSLARVVNSCFAEDLGDRKVVDCRLSSMNLFRQRYSRFIR